MDKFVTKGGSSLFSIVVEDLKEEETFRIIDQGRGRGVETSQGYSGALEKTPGAVDLYKTFMKPLSVWEKFSDDEIQEMENGLNPYPTSFVNLINSYMEEGMIEAVAEVMETIASRPGFYPPRELIDLLLTKYVLGIKDSRIASSSICILRSFLCIYPPNKCFIQISRHHRSFWDLLEEDILSANTNILHSEWALSFLLDVLEMDFKHCLSINRMTKSLIYSCLAVPGSMDFSYRKPIEIIFSVVRSCQTSDEKEFLLGSMIRILDMIVIIAMSRKSASFQIQNIFFAMSQEISKGISFDSTFKLIKMLRSVEIKLEYMDRHLMKLFSSERIRDESLKKKALIPVDLSKLCLYYCHYIGSNEDDHLDFLKVYHYFLDRYFEYKRYESTTSSKTFYGFTQTEMQSFTDQDGNILIHTLTSNATTLIKDKKKLKDALLLIKEIRNFVDERMPILKEKLEKNMESKDEIIVL